MAEVIKITITGKDFDKKSKAAEYISNQLENLNVRTCIIGSGNGCKAMSIDEYFAAEHKAEEAVKAENQRAVVISVFDVIDMLSNEKCKNILPDSENSIISADYIRNSRAAVFHLSSQDEADDRILALWTGTPHLRIIEKFNSFDEQLNKLEKEVKAFLGIPKPLEIERKFLIKYPNLDVLNKMNVCRCVPITQAYLSTVDEGDFRIRRRGCQGSEVYIKTVKKKISDIKRIEIETYITKEEYEDYISHKENITGIISKDRYCIVYDSAYYELDVYPFWDDRATLEIELLDENQPYSLPPFVSLIREVSFEKEYRNLALAQKYWLKK